MMYAIIVITFSGAFLSATFDVLVTSLEGVTPWQEPALISACHAVSTKLLPSSKRILTQFFGYQDQPPYP